MNTGSNNNDNIIPLLGGKVCESCKIKYNPYSQIRILRVNMLDSAVDLYQLLTEKQYVPEYDDPETLCSDCIEQEIVNIIQLTATETLKDVKP